MDLDALWDDFKTNHISVPEWVEGRLWFKDCIERNITYPTVQFIQRMVKDDEGRGKQKFKILSVKICAGRQARRLVRSSLFN